MARSDSPRLRRLRSDRKALDSLAAQSTIFAFSCSGDPPDRYTLVYRGPGTRRDPDSGEIFLALRHDVELRLGAEYPRRRPELRWRSPLFHPNISAAGAVCLGGYSTHWAPSLMLADLCEMLWDMLRYANYDVHSPFNLEAAQWVRQQTAYTLPLDPRSLRDRLTRLGTEPTSDVVFIE